MILRFTYRHLPGQTDANTRSPDKEIFVIHPHWQGQLHGVDLKVLTPEKLSIFKIVMNPLNNRQDQGNVMEGGVGGVSQDVGIGSDYIEKVRNPSNMTPVQESEYRLKQLNAKEEYARMIAERDGNVFNDSYYQEQRQRAESDLERAHEIEKEAAQGTTNMKNQLPAAAADILRRMKPGMMVNNPRLFYGMFLKPFIGKIDAYRIFYPGRMSSVQEISRWDWVGQTALVSRPQGVREKEKQGPQAPKYYGQQEGGEENEYSQFDFGNKIKAGQPGGGGGMKEMSPGVMENTKQERRQVVHRKVDQNNTVKTERPKRERPK
jgi:hypothetical protein